jgi:hypothetical protein
MTEEFPTLSQAAAGPNQDATSTQDDIEQPTVNTWLKRKLRLSVNVNIIDKNVYGADLGGGFENVELTIDELGVIICSGNAYCAELAEGQRGAKNFVASDILSVDIDEGVSVDQLRDHEFVRRYASLIYTTPNHTAENPRFRVIFISEKTVTDANQMRAATWSLMMRLNGDPAVTDPTRLFFGSRKCKLRVFKRGIPSAVLDELIAQGRESLRADPSDFMKRESSRSTLLLDPIREIRCANGRSGLINTLARSTAVHCSFHNDRHASAFVVENRVGEKGIHCSTCKATFWQASQPRKYDFTSFDRAVAAVHGHTNPDEDFTDSILRAIDPDHLRKAEIHYFDEKFVSDVALSKGANFIKSPKGSGKTELLKRLVQTNPGRVLLVGHRRSLIQQMCDRLGINCYLTEPEGATKASPTRARFGVCVDSIEKVPTDRPYDLVIIDESEQVLSHFISETLSECRNNAFQKLCFLIGQATHTIALDADLGWISFLFINAWVRLRRPDAKARLYVNTYQTSGKTIEIFESKNLFTGHILEAVRHGCRCFITSNSRKKVEELQKTISSAHSSARILTITSKSSGHSDAQNFLSDPAKYSRVYDVVICSPSVGSGVDITFPGGEQVFDVVFGLFEAQPLSHYEIDQQLSRVRHPKAIKVYVSPLVSNFETDFDVVLNDALALDMMDFLTVGFDAYGRRKYDVEHPLLQLVAAVLTHKRASTNHLKSHFLDLKRRQGWQVIKAAHDDTLRVLGSEQTKQGRVLADQNRKERLLNAADLTAEVARSLNELYQRGNALSREESASLDRYWLKSFYREDVSADLISLDREGAYRKAVRRFEAITNPDIIELEKYMLRTGSWNERDSFTLARFDSMVNPFLIEILEETPIFRNGIFDADVVFTADELTSFASMLSKRKARYELSFGRTLNKGYQADPVKQLSGILKYVGIGLKIRQKTTLYGRTVYRYGLDQAKLELITNIAERRKRGPSPEDNE